MKSVLQLSSRLTLQYKRYYTTNIRKLHLQNGRDFTSIIKEITTIAASPLLPEIELYLITPACKLWSCHPSLCPVPDPYWAFLWPGGQTLSRFLLDKPEIISGKNVLDLGCGGGASTIASLMSGAKFVVANDIDPIATTSVRMNVKLNPECSRGHNNDLAEKLLHSNKNIIPSNTKSCKSLDLFKDLCKEVNLLKSFRSPTIYPFDVILIGDMFYDEDMVKRLHFFLLAMKKTFPTVTILIGDPGRPQLLNQPILERMRVIAEYDLPESCTDENYGFTTACVYEFV